MSVIPKEKPFTCELCDETDDDVTIYCGGPFFKIHPKCAAIAEKAINAYLKHQLNNPLAYFVNELKEIVDEVALNSQQLRTDQK